MFRSSCSGVACWSSLTLLLACAPSDGSRAHVGDSSSAGAATYELSSQVARVNVRVLDAADRPVPNATIYTGGPNLRLVTVERSADGRTRWNAEARLQLTDQHGWWRGQVVSPPLMTLSTVADVKLTAYRFVPPNNRVIKSSQNIKLDFALDSAVREIPTVVLRLGR